LDGVHYWILEQALFVQGTAAWPFSALVAPFFQVTVAMP